MKVDDLKILSGENTHQTASIENNDRMIDYETSAQLSFTDILGINKGLEVISEFYDVKAITTISNLQVCAVALGQSLEDALLKVIDSNPIDFMNSILVSSSEIDSDLARKIKDCKIVVAPKYTENAKDFLSTHNVIFVTIQTALKNYKNYMQPQIYATPLGTLVQSPNLSELNKDDFKVVTKCKPTVEQIEDAVFSWKVAKHIKSQGIVIAKDLKTSAIAQGLQTASIEFALNYSCDMSKDAILGTDMPLTAHDINVAAQGRIALIILPSANKDIITAAEKFNIALITTGFTNISY